MLSHVSERDAFLQGLRDSVPVLIGIVPYAMIVGVAAVAVGMLAVDATAMSAVVFAGASQLAAIELIGRGAPILVIVATTLMINLRFAMYSAAMAPHVRNEPAWVRAAVGVLLTDQGFALATIRLRDHPDTPRRTYLLGVMIPIYTVWTALTAVGAILGAQVPDAWQLDFALPLTFLALLFPAIRDRPSVAAAVAGGALAIALRGLPYNLGLVIASLAGVGVGASFEVLRDRARA